MSELNPEDLYLLRKLRMDVDKRNLELQKAQQELARSALELEHKYGLIGGPKAIDPQTGIVNEAPSMRSRNGKGQPEELLSATVEAAD